MSKYARVGSVEDLKRFRVSLCKFAEIASAALDEAGSDIQRTMVWLNHDRHAHWKGQVRQSTERLALAKRALVSKKNLEESEIVGRQSHIDERKAIAAAQRQLDEAQQKLADVRRWSGLFEKESFAYKCLVQALRNALQIEIPNARAQMDNMIDAIEAYAALAPPSAATQPEPSTQLPGAARTPSAPATTRRTVPLGPTTPPDYQSLRQNSPPADIRQQTQLSDLACHWLGGTQISLAARQALAEINLPPAVVSDSDKILVADITDYQGPVYLERTTPAAADDTGWYIGIVDDARKLPCLAVRGVELLQVCPDLADILTLPVGYLVVLDDASIEAVLDPDDKLVWPGKNLQRRDQAN